MTDRLEVQLLGSASFLLNGQPLKSLPTRASQALLIYLLHQNHPIERERLIDMFYQASTPKQAAANFRSMLSRLRKELAPFLEITNRSVAIHWEADIWVDTAVFAKNISNGNLEEALSFYHGDFLAGFFLRDAPEFENWALVERERLRLLAIEAMQKQAAAYERKGNYWGALKTVNQLLAVESLLEETHQSKMLLLARTGQRPLALQHYAETVQLFEDELGVAVSAKTTAVYERIASLPSPAPAMLPASTDEFIGREAEIQTITELLAEPSRRLLTLFGMGGIGKTRLALESARQIAANKKGMFLDGIFFISFVGVETAVSNDAIPLHLMQTMGLPLGGRETPAAQALAALRKREMLLIFDNLEHIMAQSSQFVADLLREAPAIKLITTSRERLNLIEETVFDLSGLPFEAVEPLESDAAKLFVTHAQRHQFTFKPNADDTPAITQMCQLLEGIPLGIELAAGSVRHARCAEIAQKIEENLGYLSSPFQNVPERHRSLRAVFMHSWELLALDLRPIFAELSVFPASFTQEAAQAIAEAYPAHLAALVDKALLKLENGRYAVHPMLREFAAEQLEKDRVVNLRNRHAQYFAEYIATRSQSYHRPTYLNGLPDLEAAYDNLIPAWRWALDQLVENELEAAWTWVTEMRRPLTRLHYQKTWFHAARTLYEEARQKLETAGWHAPDAAKSKRLLHAQITVAQSNSARILGDAATAIGPAKAAIPILRENVALDDLFDAYNILVGSNLELRTFDAIPDFLDEMEAIAAETQKPVMFGVLYVSQSYYTEFMGDPERALAYAQQALESFQELEDTYYEAIVLDGIARRLFSLNRPDEAAHALQKAYALAAQNGQTLTMAFTQKGLASYYQKKGMLAEAEQAAHICRQLFTEVNEQRNLVEVDFLEALIAYEREQWREMTRFMIASLNRAREQHIGDYLLYNVVYLPILQWQRGEPTKAYALVRFLCTQESFNEDQLAVLAAADALMSGISSESKNEAKVMAGEMSMDTIVDTFLREGLKWFA